MSPSNEPLITVVTPSFNQARYLESTLRSIHSQGYPNLEHIVMDGGSSDGSVEILKRYQHLLASWVSGPDGGQTRALIRGFSQANGDILCWLNSDDLFYPDTLHRVAEHFSRDPGSRFVYGDATWVDMEGREIKPKREHPFSRFVFMYDHNFIPQPSTFWRADLYAESGGLDATFDLAMDADLWIRFADLTKPVHVRELWSKMRFYPDQKTTRLRDESIAELERIRQRYQPPESKGLRAIKRTAARVLRVGWKLVSGAYSPSEIARHAGMMVGRGTWESQEKKRADG